MLALRRAVTARSLRAFSTTSPALKNSKTADEALAETATQAAEFEASTGAQASENKTDDPAARLAKKIGNAAKAAAAEVDAQVQSYQDAELGLPQKKPGEKK